MGYYRSESDLANRGWTSTYLRRRKTHLQVVRSLMAPPIIGPAKREMAYTIAMFAPKAAHFAGGTMSVIMVIPRAKLLPLPMP
jgi:hypothetical protein